MREGILITGATGGLGKEFANYYANKHKNLVLVARNEEKLTRLAEKLASQYEVEVLPVVQDMASDQAAHKVFEYVKEQGWKVDGLINNAGFGDFGLFYKMSLERQTQLIQVNILSLMQMTHLFLADMVENNCGFIMNIASTAAFQPGPLMSSYYASKAFVLSFTEGIARELKGTKVRIMAMCPGPTKTGFEKNANLENSKLFRNLKGASPKSVVKQGCKALERGKVVYIAGTMNRIIAFMPRILSRNFVRNFVYKTQEEI